MGIVVPQHFLYFFPLPQGHGSFLPGFMVRLNSRGERSRVPYGPPLPLSSKRAPNTPNARNEPSFMLLYLTALLAILNHVAVKGSRMLVALYAIELGASPLAIGALVLTYAVFPLALAVYAGRVTDRRGVRRPMMVGSLGMATGLVLPAAFPGLTTLFLSSAIIETAALFFQISIHNLIGSLGEGHERTRNLPRSIDVRLDRPASGRLRHRPLGTCSDLPCCLQPWRARRAWSSRVTRVSSPPASRRSRSSTAVACGTSSAVPPCAAPCSPAS